MNNESMRLINWPNYFPPGKTSFLLDIDVSVLKVGSEINFEFSDCKENEIILDITGIIESGCQVISANITEKNIPGKAILIITGVLKSGKKFKKTYTSEINWFKTNCSPIRFNEIPKVIITESIHTYLDRTWNGNETTSLSGSDLNGYYKNNEYIIHTDQNDFTTDMINGDLYVSGIDYSASIQKVISKNIAIICPGYYTSTRTGSKKILTTFKDKSYNIDYNVEPSSYTQSFNSQSYANITLTNLDYYSGKIEEIKVSYKESNADKLTGTIIHTIPITTQDILFDRDTQLSKGRMDTLNGWNILTSSYSCSLDNEYLLNHIKFIPDDNPMSQSSDVYTIMELENNISLSKDVEYILKFDTRWEVWPTWINSEIISKYRNDAKLEVYFSGSNVGDNRLLFLDEEQNNIFLNTEISFIPTNDTTGSFRFKILTGTWYLSDISLDYNLNNLSKYSFEIPLITNTRDNKKDFKIEFINPNNELALESIIKNEISFIGSNLYIDGSDNYLADNGSVKSLPTEGEFKGVVWNNNGITFYSGASKDATTKTGCGPFVFNSTYPGQGGWYSGSTQPPQEPPER